MLDSESTNSPDTTPSDSRATGTEQSDTRPRKRAPRKRAAAAPPETQNDAATPPADAPEEAQPAARTPRKRGARKAGPAAADAAAESAAESAAEATSGSASEAAADSASKPTQSGDVPARPRKRAARKAAAPDAASQQPAATPESADRAVEVEAAPAPPAKKSTRKRVAKKAAAAAEGTPERDAVPEDDAAPPSRAQAVLFQAPEGSGAAGGAATADAGTAPRRRGSRASAKTTGPARSTEPKTAAEPAPADADIAAAEDIADRTAEPEDVREIAAEQASGARRRRRRGRRGRGGAARTTDAEQAEAAEEQPADTQAGDGQESDGQPAEGDAAGAEPESASTRRRRRRRRSGAGGSDAELAPEAGDPANTVVHVRDKRAEDDGVRAVKGSTRLEAKRQRRRDGRETTRRRAPILTEAEFLARREAVDRVMAVRQHGDRTQIAVLEDGVLVEHYVTRASATSYVGNVYLGRVQNVLPSMEAAFVDIGKGRNGVLYAGEVNWDAAGLEGKARAIEQALKSGDTVLVQVTKDPIGHKGARLTSQVSLPGRFLVYVPGGGMTGISRRLPDTERHRLKAILRKIVPDEAGVIVRTAAEGASEEDLRHDVERLRAQWDAIEQKAKQGKNAPSLVHGEPDLAIRVVRDVFNEDFNKLVVEGDDAWDTVSEYIRDVAPDLAERVSKHVSTSDLFAELRVDEQLLKALDRKVWLPSGGSLVIDRTEAMTVIDVNTGKFVGAGGNLEQTVTRNNLEAAEEIVRQLRLRDVGGIVVIDFIDMVLESNRDLVLRRLVECLGRDRTKHQVAEVTSLGLVQMTRKRVGEGLLEAFSEPCEVCHGRGVIVHTEPLDRPASERPDGRADDERPKGRRKRGTRGGSEPAEPLAAAATAEQRQAATAAIAAIHRAAGGEATDGAATDAADGVPADTSAVVDELAGDLVAAALDAQQGSAESDEHESQQPAPARSRGRRSRRAATRPAGPPVPAMG